MQLGGAGGAAGGAGAAPFSFTPAGKGQAPAAAANFSFAPGGAGGAPTAFSFSTGGEGSAAPAGGAPFQFNFTQPKPGEHVEEEEDDDDEDDDDDDDDDDVDHVAEFLNSLPEAQKAAVMELTMYDDEVSELEKDFRKELRELERKYEKKYAPIFTKRALVVTGETKNFAEGKGDGSGVPDFWLRAMNNCMVVSSNITEKDEVILKSLTDVQSETLPEADGVGFRLTFTFAKNEFFSNQTLTKVYHMADSGEDPVLEKAVGTEINWHEGKNVTVKIKKKKQRNKNGKGTRVVTKTEPCESFFNFFSPPKIPGLEEDEEELEEEEMEQRQMELESDYEMGIAFQERIVPHALKWFTGEAEDDDEYDDYDEDEEFDEDDLDDDEDDEDEPRQRGGGHGGMGGGGRGGRGGGGGGGRGGRGGRGGGRGGGPGGQQECKQQ